MTFTLKPATRQGFKPLIGLYAESGCGKTHSSLLLARGLVGPSGKIIMADTEAGRGSLYADVIPGGYQTFQLTTPFRPKNFVEAVDFAEKEKADVLIIDNASHEWEGIGGVLDWATENEGRGMKGRLVWKDPKMEHEKFVQRLAQSSIPIIVCMRAKHLLVEGKDDRGHKTMTKDPNATPKQAEDFIYGMTAHAEILPDHALRLTKMSHPTLGACFPATGPITIEHGERLAKWCANPGTTVAPKFIKDNSILLLLKSDLWKLTKTIHLNDKAALEQWLHDEILIHDDETLEDLTLERLPAIIEKVKKKLKP